MPKQTLKMKIADLLAQKGEGDSVAGDAGVAGDADIGAPPAESPMPDMPPAPMPEAPEMETDVVGGMPGVLMAGAMEEDYDAPEMGMNEKRDAAVSKSMNGEDGYAAWQPKGDPYRYELIMGDADDMSDAYIVATKDGKSIKIRADKQPDVFEKALMMNPDFVPADMGEENISGPALQMPAMEIEGDPDKYRDSGDPAAPSGEQGVSRRDVYEPMEIKGDIFSDNPGPQGVGAQFNMIPKRQQEAIEAMAAELGLNPEDAYERLAMRKNTGS